MNRRRDRSLLLGLAVVLGAMYPAQPAPAQSLADSVQVILLAVQGARSPNGPLTQIYPWVGCVAVERMMCRSPHPPGDHSASLISAVSAALNLPVARDSAQLKLQCPWRLAIPGARKGVGLEIGRVQFAGDSAVVFIGRSCSLDNRRGFAEGGMAVLRRVDGAWKFVVMRDTFIT